MFFTALLILSGGYAVFSQTFINQLEQRDSIDRWIGVHLDSAFAYSGNFSSATDSARPYGLGVEIMFPEAVRNKNTLLTVHGFVLSEKPWPNAHYVISIENNGETAFWEGLAFSKLISDKNRWFEFTDTVLIPANLTKTGKLKTYLWNAGRKSPVYLDDLSISFKPYPNPSFLSDIDSLPDYINRSQGRKIFENRFYQIWEQDDAGFKITDTAGRTLVNDIRYFYHEAIKKQLFTGFSFFRFVKATVKSDSIRLFFKSTGGKQRVKLRLVCSNNSPEINFKIIRKFSKKSEVYRTALLFNYQQPLKEVYRSNRKADTSEFQNEYWLDKQGFLAGDNKAGLALYHAPGISSVQLNIAKNLAVINLDFEKDHPYLQFPLNADTFDLKVDESTSVYKRGDKREYVFKLWAGVKPEPLPRFMKNPDGFQATYIWTEHADWGDIRTHRATYFGSEKISNADSATGGFVKYNIPVTKSVFYDNPDSIRNTVASDSLFTSLESAIKTDTAFRNFLFQLRDKGNEICLHTPEQYTTTPARLEEALSYMKDHFDSPTWIDHGYNNLPQNNREDFVCSGVDNFAAPLWKQYGIKYFWNPWYEDFEAFRNWGFFGSIENFYRGFGDFMPEPDFWKHPSRTGSFYHWPTYSVLYIEHEGLWNYFFSEHQFNIFTDDWGVEINHCYPAWTLPGKGFWKYSTDSTIVAMDGFNRTLSRMAALRDKGVLNVTTVKDFLNYQLLLENISYSILPDGRIKLTNRNSSDIKGLSFAVKAEYVLVNGLKPAQKTVNDNLVFWFNLDAGSSAVIRVIK